MDELAVEAVSKVFGGLTALHEVTFSVPKGEIVGLIGPNGSGKTTLLNVISGAYGPDSGRVTLAGTAISGRRPHRVASAGIARTFQNVRLFPQMSALENVQVGAIVGRRRGGDEPRRAAWWWLERSGLLEHALAPAVSLPYGVQRRLEMARALAARPSHLLLDEPAAGMNEAESDDLLAAIRAVQGAGAIGLLVIDHDLRLITRLCDRVVVLNGGRVIAHGTADEVTRDAEVIDAYLGRRASRPEGGPART